MILPELLTIVMVCSSGILAAEESVTRGMAELKRAGRQLEWGREDEEEREGVLVCNRQSDGESAGREKGTTKLVLAQALLQVPL